MKLLEPRDALTAEQNDPADKEPFVTFVTSLGGHVIQRYTDGLAHVLIEGQHYYLNPGEWLVCHGSEDREVLDDHRFTKRYFVKAFV
jgi:hypothetical protein